jgi:hypothetical protein
MGLSLRQAQVRVDNLDVDIGRFEALGIAIAQSDRLPESSAPVTYLDASGGRACALEGICAGTLSKGIGFEVMIVGELAEVALTSPAVDGSRWEFGECERSV